MSEFSLKQIQVFVAVAELGSFTQADAGPVPQPVHRQRTSGGTGDGSVHPPAGP